MKKILSIVSSVKGSESFSVKLSEAIINKLLQEEPGSSVTRRNLAVNPFPHMEETMVAGFYTPEELRTTAHNEAVAHSDAAIAQVMDADAIVIGVPLYNFGIPSTLKAWIDQVMRAGKTFSYANGRPEGLVKNKKVYLAIASGAVYSEGPMKAYDFTENYLRAVLGFAGMTDITVIRVEGTSMPDMKEVAMSRAIERVNELVA